MTSDPASRPLVFNLLSCVRLRQVGLRKSQVKTSCYRPPLLQLTFCRCKSSPDRQPPCDNVDSFLHCFLHRNRRSLLVRAQGRRSSTTQLRAEPELQFRGLFHTNCTSYV